MCLGMASSRHELVDVLKTVVVERTIGGEEKIRNGVETLRGRFYRGVAWFSKVYEADLGGKAKPSARSTTL